MSKKEKRSKVRATLEKKETFIKNQEQTVCRYQFLDEFVLCEVVCKSVVSMYRKNNKTFTSEKDLKLDMKEIPAALKYAGYVIDLDVLNPIFAGSGNYRRRGSKSAKQLRNAIIHNLSEPDVLEMYNRYEYLHNTMNSFLNYFRNAVHRGDSIQKNELPNKAA